jgi:CheY-like chemotaxis protein
MAMPGEPDKIEVVADIVQGKGEKILVVDDEIEMLKAMPDLLENLGYKASIAGSGEEAIDIYKTWHPDVILMDICMPGMNGVACLDEILAYDPNAKTIIISGYEAEHAAGLDEHKNKLIKGYLTKPVDIYEFSVLLARVLSRPD